MDGAAVTTTSGGIGGVGAQASAGGTGTVIISGTGSSWTTGQFGVFKGSMSILDGGLMATTYTRIGIAAADNATVLVSGAGSKLTGSLDGSGAAYTEVGGAGTGILTISNQGNVTVGSTGAGTLRIATSATGRGTLNIGGALGQAATAAGTLDAAIIQFGAGAGLVNFNHTDTNYVFATLMQGAGAVQQNGPGTTILTADNTYSGGTTINAGTLQLGNGGTSGTIVGDVTNHGTLAFNRSNDLTFGGVISGTGAVNQLGANTTTLTGVNTYGGLTTISAGTLALTGSGSIADSSRVHADGTFDISGTTAGASIKSLSGSGLVDLGTQTLTLTNAFSTFAGIIQGTGGLTHAGGTQTLSGANTYTGATTVTGGTLRAGATNTFSSASATAVQSDGTLDLEGFDQILQSLDNAGLVRLGGAPGTTLTVTGDYVANGGTLNVNTQLGGDSSPSDLLVVNGDTSGTGNVRVTNIGGGGAQTVEGIKIIDVVGASNGTFSLLGDYVFHGEQAVVGGAYAYTLHKDGVSTPEDGDWYLRSSLINPPPESPPGPIYQAGVPVYEAYPQALLALNGLATLQQRVGNRSWGGNSGSMTGEAAASTSSGASEVEGGAYWGRIEVTRNRVDPKVSTSLTSYDVDTFRMQAGLDSQLFESKAGKLIGGFTLHYANASTDVRSYYGTGSISTDGYGFGSTLTWYGANGFYVDGQTQATWYDSSLTSRLAGRTLASGNEGFGYAFSVEAGQRFELAPNWSLTPQAQLVWSSVSFDSFNDRYDARVSLDRADSLRGRVGLALDYKKAWRDQDGTKSRMHVYGIANLYNEFSDGTEVDVAGTSFESRGERLWGGIGVGGSLNWNDDKYSLYGQATADTSLDQFGDSFALSGTAGLRVKF